MRTIRYITKLGKKWFKKASGSHNKYAKEFIELSRYSHEITDGDGAVQSTNDTTSDIK